MKPKPATRFVLIGLGAILLLGLGMVVLPKVNAQTTAYPYYVERVTDIAPGGRDANPEWLTEVKGDLYFRADDQDAGLELWKYSPRTGKATLAADINKGPGDSTPEWLTVYGYDIYFTAADDQIGRQLWRHSTLSGETHKVFVKEQSHLGVPVGSDPQWLEFMGPILFFTADSGAKHGRELWAYDTRDARTWRVKDINPGAADSEPKYLLADGQRLYFTADDGVHGRELWRSDGTESGTFMVKDILAGPRSSSPDSFNKLGDQYVFAADDGYHGRELWRSYGFAASTSMVKDIYSGTLDADPGWSNRLGESVVFFPAETKEYGNELWRYDQQGGAYLLADINVGDNDSDPAAIGDLGWVMFFSADDGDTGRELWKTEPPYGVARQVIDINPGEDDSTPKTLEKLGTTLFFIADDGEHGEELWVSELPYETADLLKDIKPGKRGSIPEFKLGEFTDTKSNALRIGWTIYFTAGDGKHGVELWQISTGALPQTGFAPGVVSKVAAKPHNAYQKMSGLWLEIPKFEEINEIVGVPKAGNSWNVDWLGPKNVGYLSGTAFPTWQGNTVISGHVYNADGNPGPFVNLGDLSWGDEVIIHAWGQQHIYQVRAVDRWVDPNDESILAHKDHDWITLITCRGYRETSDTYRWRTVAQAVLIKIIE